MIQRQLGKRIGETELRKRVADPFTADGSCDGSRNDSGVAPMDKRFKSLGL